MSRLWLAFLRFFSSALRADVWIRLFPLWPRCTKTITSWFYRKSIGLEDLPHDIVFAISLHLSVRDLCFLRATSRRLASLVLERSLWYIVLRDILEVKPLPRVKFCLEKMGLEEIRLLAMRLAAHDRKFRITKGDIRVSPPRQLSTLSEPMDDLDPSVYISGSPVLLPGGKYFVTLEFARTTLLVHDFHASTLSDGHLLVPITNHRIRDWQVIPYSESEFLVAVIELDKETGVLDEKNRQIPRSYVTIYRCHIPSRESVVVDHFMIDIKMTTFFFDSAFFALMWISGDWSGSQTNAYIRRYRDKLATPIIRLEDSQSSRGASISLLTKSHLIIVGNGTAIYPLPELQFVSDDLVSGPPIAQNSIYWCNRHPRGHFQPYIVSLLPSHDAIGPPPSFIVIRGRELQVLSILSGEDELRYTADSAPMFPGEGRYDLMRQASCIGQFSGIYSIADCRLRWFTIPIQHPHSRGPLRLDLTSNLSTSAVSCIDTSLFEMEDDEYFSSVSHDEESGRLALQISKQADVMTDVTYRLLFMQLEL